MIGVAPDVTAYLDAFMQKFYSFLSRSMRGIPQDALVLA